MTRLITRKYSVALCCAVFLIVVLFILQTSEREVAVKPRLFDLIANESSIAAVEISRGNTRIAMVSTDAGWRISHHEKLKDYPVDPLVMSRLIRFVLDAKYVERKTDRPEKLGKLGLALEVDQSASVGPVLLSVEAMSKESQVLVGNLSQSGLGTYVRVPNESQVWLVSGRVKLPLDVLDWISPVFLNIDRAEIVRATFTSPTGARVVVSASGNTESAIIENMPVGTKLAYDSVPDTALDALINLRLIEVRRADYHAWEDAASAAFELSSGSLILLRCTEINGKYWVLVARDGITDQWSYAVDQYRFAQLTKEMNDYLAITQDNGE
ncbi:DUF4340 domain-containing protein [Pseudomonadales bacterium]|nr:DUF4340 domain-containing protein [Pseudomonadales bacterium]